MTDEFPCPNPACTHAFSMAELQTSVQALRQTDFDEIQHVASEMQAIIERADRDKEKKAAQRLAAILQQQEAGEHS